MSPTWRPVFRRRSWTCSSPSAGRRSPVAAATTLCVGGGVAANTRLRERLEEAARADGFSVVIAPLSLCTDNAAMSAIAWEHLAQGRTASLDLDVSAGLVRRR